MEGKIMFWFDEEGDVLDISIDRPRKAVSKEVGKDILVRIDPKKKDVVGFTILNFTKRFKGLKEVEIPLKAKFTPIST